MLLGSMGPSHAIIHLLRHKLLRKTMQHDATVLPMPLGMIVHYTDAFFDTKALKNKETHMLFIFFGIQKTLKY